MNPNWLGVTSAVMALAAFFLAYFAAKDAPAKKRIVFTGCAIIAAIPGASFAAYYGHILPESSWYYEFRSITGTELLIVLLGVAGGMVATLLPRALLVLPLLCVAAFSIAPIIKPFIGPIPAGTMQDKWDGEICLQSTPSSCGAASTATILKQLGVDATESEIAAEAHSYAGGTEAWHLARAARSRGLVVDFSFTRGFTPEDGLPAVVGVRLGAIGHFIPVLSQEDDLFFIGDPLKGREILSRKQLHERYEFTGFHMRIKKHPSRQ